MQVQAQDAPSLPAPKPRQISRPAVAPLAPHPGYQDRANVTAQEMKALVASQQPLGGPKNNRTPFPYRLHEMLTSVQKDKESNFEHVVSWQSHGRAFLVHPSKHKVFVDQVLPKYFKQSKYTSFQRQLNLYGFRRLTGPGPDQGAYYHEYFLKNKPYLADQIVITKIKGTNYSKPSMHPELEPKLYSYPPVTDDADEDDVSVKTVSLPAEGQDIMMSPVKKSKMSHSGNTTSGFVTPHKVTPQAVPRQMVTQANREMVAKDMSLSLRLPCLDAAMQGFVQQKTDKTLVTPARQGHKCFRSLSNVKDPQNQDTHMTDSATSSVGPSRAFLVSPDPSPVQQERLPQGGEPHWSQEPDLQCPITPNAATTFTSTATAENDAAACLTFEGQSFYFLEPFDSIESFLKHQNEQQLGSSPADAAAAPPGSSVSILVQNEELY